MSWMQTHFFWPKLGMLRCSLSLVRELSETFGRVHNRLYPLEGQEWRVVGEGEMVPAPSLGCEGAVCRSWYPWLRAAAGQNHDWCESHVGESSPSHLSFQVRWVLCVALELYIRLAWGFIWLLNIGVRLFLDILPKLQRVYSISLKNNAIAQ